MVGAATSETSGSLQERLLALLNGRQDLNAYINAMVECMLPFTFAHHSYGFVYQKDQASIQGNLKISVTVKSTHLGILIGPNIARLPSIHLSSRCERRASAWRWRRSALCVHTMLLIQTSRAQSPVSGLQ